MNVVVRDIAERLDEEPLLMLERFHGHLGPYVVLGYRMGRLARKALDVGAFDLSAEVFTGTEPPLSCLVDGVQVGSSCTLGKGNIQVHDGRRAEARFSTKDGRTMLISIQEWVIDLIEAKVDKSSRYSIAEMEMVVSLRMPWFSRE
jgi:formylmethanofuran dehydrogenase subunit E